MRAVIQRASSANIIIDKNEQRHIAAGLVVFLSVMTGDTMQQAEYLADKICEMRIFEDEHERMNVSLIDSCGDLLVVSNFTLGADCRKGRRPYFGASASPQEAIPLYEHFVACCREKCVGDVKTGEFGSHMDISVDNNGPVTIFLDTAAM